MYSDLDVSALDSAQLQVLPRLTAFGLAMAEGTIGDLIEPHVQRDLRSLTIQRLALQLAADATGVGEDELRRIYQSRPRYELTVRHLVVLSERWRPSEHRDSAQARAEEALARVQAGESFPEVAGRYSDEPGADQRGGLLQPGREGSWVPEFWEAASALPVGGVSEVVETEFGYHVPRLEDRRVIPFEEVRDEVLEEVMSLPQALGHAGSWALDPVSAGTVDTAALDAWRVRGTDTTVVRWPDSLGIPGLGGGQVSEYIRTLPAASRPDRPLSRADALQTATSAARMHVMDAEAKRRGIEPSESQQAAIRERWRRRVTGWASALGLEEGIREEAVKQNALQLVESVRQSAAIARAELEELEPVLYEAYPVHRASDSPAGGDAGPGGT